MVSSGYVVFVKNGPHLPQKFWTFQVVSGEFFTRLHTPLPALGRLAAPLRCGVTRRGPQLAHGHPEGRRQGRPGTPVHRHVHLPGGDNADVRCGARGIACIGCRGTGTARGGLSTILGSFGQLGNCRMKRKNW